ncbi:hypothetical protein RUND412_005401 [Rhizina undulata]
MGDNNTEPKKRSVVRCSGEDNVGKLFVGRRDGILPVKEKVYDGLVGQLEIEGYPSEADPDFKEANINDLVIFIMHPSLRYFKRQTGRDLRLRREKEIITVNSETGDMEKFVVMDFVSLREKNFVLIVEAKKVSLGEARKQCFLSMKDMRDNNGGSTVYGFITTGDSWRMASYDGTFQMSEKMEILLDTIDDDKERWIKDYSILVDCFNVALNYGGIMKK